MTERILHGLTHLNKVLCKQEILFVVLYWQKRFLNMTQLEGNILHLLTIVGKRRRNRNVLSNRIPKGSDSLVT